MHGEDFLASEAADEQAAAVAFDGADGEVGDFGVGDALLDFYLVGQFTESRAQDDGRGGLAGEAAFEPGCCFENFCVHSLVFFR